MLNLVGYIVGIKPVDVKSSTYIDSSKEIKDKDAKFSWLYCWNIKI